ncbi:hypothetical protein J1N35_018017 [Gossypium stocksii]|uniref:Uncharacterized protein n=1 Tax=Gossypium stocksii TaxID=47602 RepID=A0A9D4A6P1_9ROSI|nr:hypothetical protein J1N35_018017 [Gossypium stocksii]
MIVIVTMVIHNFIRKYVCQNDADFMEYENIDSAYDNIIDPEDMQDRESDDNDNDGESNNLSDYELELTEMT